jgi:predicted neutral ceramidase superfamily lipid hydrolase
VDVNLKLAASAHERLMMNLAIFHLLLPVAALSSGYLTLFLSLSLIGSFLMMWSIHQKAVTLTDAFARLHWQQAWKRCRLLLLSYFVAGVIMLLGLLLASIQSDHGMYGILLVVFSRIAAVPIVLMVLALFVMATTDLSLARRGLEVK